LLLLFNNILKSGEYPSSWKNSVIHPIYKKKGSKSDVNNYRPISNLPLLNKWFEIIVKTKLMEYLDTNNMLSDKQHGFRSGRSCSTALTIFSQFIFDNLDKSKNAKVAVLFVDLKKGFDYVCHIKLIKTLKNCFKLNNLYLKMLHNYFVNRTFVIVLGNFVSKKFKYNRGVVQGSVLGPILFNIFFNGITTLLESLGLRFLLFADDLCIFVCNDCLQTAISTLQMALVNINDWCNQAGLLINFEKTKYMIFHRQNVNIDNNTVIQCDNNVIENVPEFKYLGVYFDSKLTFNAHYKYVENRYSSAMGALNYIKRIVPFKIFVSLINAYVLPLSDYALPIWGPTKKIHLKALQAKINIILTIHVYPSFAKFYTKKYWGKCKNDTTEVKKSLTEACKKAHSAVDFWKIIERANLLTVTERLDYFSLMFFKKIDVLGTKCIDLEDFFVHSGSSSERITRNNRNLCVISHDYEMYKNSVKYYVSKIWNKLPLKLKENEYSVAKFSTLINEIFLSHRKDNFIA